ncbi:MAG: hypothetical protein HY259_14070 [Chloroflexi bacterium]|nr:hypothetical protein [Chloroflexota bacterium]
MDTLVAKSKKLSDLEALSAYQKLLSGLRYRLAIVVPPPLPVVGPNEEDVQPLSGISDSTNGRLLHQLFSRLYPLESIYLKELGYHDEQEWPTVCKKLLEEYHVVIVGGPHRNPLARWLLDKVQSGYTFKRNGDGPYQIYDLDKEQFKACPDNQSENQSEDFGFLRWLTLTVPIGENGKQVNQRVIWIAGNHRLGTTGATRLLLSEGNVKILSEHVPVPDPHDFAVLVKAAGSPKTFTIGSCKVVGPESLPQSVRDIKVENKYDVNLIVARPTWLFLLRSEPEFLFAPGPSLTTSFDKDWPKRAKGRPVLYTPIESLSTGRTIGYHALAVPTSPPADELERIKTILQSAAEHSLFSRKPYELYLPILAGALDEPLIDIIGHYSGKIPPRRLFLEIVDLETSQYAQNGHDSLLNSFLIYIRKMGIGLSFCVTGRPIGFLIRSELRPERVKVKWFLDYILSRDEKKALVRKLLRLQENTFGPYIIEEGADSNDARCTTYEKKEDEEEEPIRFVTRVNKSTPDPQ